MKNFISRIWKKFLLFLLIISDNFENDYEQNFLKKKKKNFKYSLDYKFYKDF